MRLQELTGYESGYVDYQSEGIVANWSDIDGLPRMFVNSVLGLRDGNDLVETTLSEGEKDRALAAARGAGGDPSPTIDKAYRNEEAIVVTFKGWS